MKTTNKHTVKSKLATVPTTNEVKELTLDDLASITGGGFEDAKNKGGES